MTKTVTLPLRWDEDCDGNPRLLIGIFEIGVVGQRRIGEWLCRTKYHRELKTHGKFYDSADKAKTALEDAVISLVKEMNND